MNPFLKEYSRLLFAIAFVAYFVYGVLWILQSVLEYKAAQARGPPESRYAVEQNESENHEFGDVDEEVEQDAREGLQIMDQVLMEGGEHRRNKSDEDNVKKKKKRRATIQITELLPIDESPERHENSRLNLLPFQQINAPGGEIESPI